MYLHTYMYKNTTILKYLLTVSWTLNYTIKVCLGRFYDIWLEMESTGILCSRDPWNTERQLSPETLEH